MGKSTNGPDWTDCAVYASEIAKGQECHITLLMSVGGGVGGQRWRITLLATDEKPSLSGPLWSAGVDVFFPHSTYRSMEAAVFTGLAKLDQEIWRTHYQEKVELK